jgi:hypothetical protein
MRRPRRGLIRVEGLRRGLTIRCENPRAFRLLPQQVRRRTCSASELKRNCDQHDKSKDQERPQASHCQSGTIASDQFRHFSPPSSPGIGGSSPRAAPALPKPGGIDTPGPAQPSFNARTLSRIEEKLARVRGRSPRAARRRGEAECATTPGLAKRTDCVRAHWLMEQRAARWRVPALENLAAAPGCAGSPPQDSEDSQERPPKRVGGLVRDDSEDDADHDTDQRDEISDAQSHVASPLRRRPGN